MCASACVALELTFEFLKLGVRAGMGESLGPCSIAHTLLLPKGPTTAQLSKFRARAELELELGKWRRRLRASVSGRASQPESHFTFTFIHSVAWSVSLHANGPGGRCDGRAGLRLGMHFICPFVHSVDRPAAQRDGQGPCTMSRLVVGLARPCGGKMLHI